MSEKDKSDIGYDSAFPWVVQEDGFIEVRTRGLTKREWFAGMASIGLLAFMGKKHGDVSQCSLNEVAALSFDFGEAMIRMSEVPEV